MMVTKMVSGLHPLICPYCNREIDKVMIELKHIKYCNNQEAAKGGKPAQATREGELDMLVKTKSKPPRKSLKKDCEYHTSKEYDWKRKGDDRDVC